MVVTPTLGPATVLPPDSALLPALRPLAGRAAAQQALLWRPHDALAPTGVLLPADLRAEAAGVLEPRGFHLLAEDVKLGPLTPSRGPGGAPLSLPLGPRDLYAPRRAWSELVSVHPGIPDVQAAALEAALAEHAAGRDREVVRRAAAETDLLALGDLLQTSAVAPGPATARLVRALAAGLAAEDPGRLGALALVLQHDARDAGVTPLAGLALGAALWAQAGAALPPDAALEAALAGAALRLPPAGPPPGPLDPPAPFQPPALAPDVDSPLQRRAADLARLALDAEDPDALAAAARLGRDPGLDDAGRLGLLLADAHRGLPATARRRRARRLLAGRDAARARELLPELAGVDAAVAALADAPPAERERALARVRAGLDELAREEPPLVQGELGAARAALDALRPAGAGAGRVEPAGQGPRWVEPQVFEPLDLALAAAEGRTDLEARARRVVDAWVAAATPRPAHELGPALTVLARAGASPFDPATAGPRALEALVHLHALRRAQGGAPPRALVARVLERDEQGVRLAPLAAGLDPQALALLLGLALPVDRAAALLLPRGDLPDVALLLAPRDARRWEGVLRGQRVVVTPLDEEELEPALAARLAGSADGLELPAGTAPCPALGPGRYALVAPRVEGDLVAATPAAVTGVALLLQALHARELVLGDDPLRAARRRADGRLALTGLDPVASADPARRAAGQRADVERLAAAAQPWSPAPPPPAALASAEAFGRWFAHAAAGARDVDPGDLRRALAWFVEDLLAEGPPLTAAGVRGALPAWLQAAAGPEVVRDVLLDVEEEGWASGRFAVEVGEDGRHTLRAAGGA